MDFGGFRVLWNQYVLRLGHLQLGLPFPKRSIVDNTSPEVPGQCRNSPVRTGIPKRGRGQRGNPSQEIGNHIRREEVHIVTLVGQQFRVSLYGVP